MKKHLQRGFLLWLSCLPAIALAGWDSNGGDIRRDHHNPWFFNEEVPYCVGVGEDFPLSLTAANQQVQDAITKWVLVLRRYGFDASLGNAYQRLIFRDAISRRIATNFRYQGRCDESENDVPLEVHFGTHPEVIRRHLGAVGETHYGLAIRKDYDHRHFRNRGIVWIHDFSQDPRKIFQILLHEFGHVFGFRHDSTFIMNRHVHELVSDDGCLPWGEIESPLWSIDHPVRQMIHLTQCGPPYQLRLLPEGIRERFGMGTLGQFEVYLRYGDVLAGTRGREREITLAIKDVQATRFHEIEGVVTDRKYDPSRAPGVWTTWRDKTSGHQVQRRQAFRQAYGAEYGYLMVAERKVPIEIRYDLGLDLAVFDEESGRWLFIHNVFRQRRSMQ